MGNKSHPLFEGIIDYAGLFPPAKLKLPDAFNSFLALQKGEFSWMVNRFVCPANQLADLASLLQDQKPDAEFFVSVIGDWADDFAEWESKLEINAQQMDSFFRQTDGLAEIAGLEIRIPSNKTPSALHDLKAFQHIDVYAEVPLNDQMAENLAAVAETDWIKAKGRTGSIHADQIPSPAALTEFLIQALDLELPFKLTAGLHEPLYHFDDGVGANLFGFLNIMAACSAHLQQTLTPAEFENILTQTTSNDAAIQTGGWSWGDYRFSAAEVESMRDCFEGFGSCSVDEPVEGLKRINMLGAQV